MPTECEPNEKVISIAVDREVWHNARVQALKARMKTGKYVEQALKEKFEREGEK